MIQFSSDSISPPAKIRKLFKTVSKIRFQHRRQKYKSGRNSAKRLDKTAIIVDKNRFPISFP